MDAYILILFYFIHALPFTHKTKQAQHWESVGWELAGRGFFSLTRALGRRLLFVFVQCTLNILSLLYFRLNPIGRELLM